MNGLWALCLLVAAIDGTTSPPPPLPVSHLIPESLSKLLAAQPDLLQHHEGYLKQLAARPALAEAETAWWQASTAPALRSLALHFEEALTNNDTASLRFDAFYTALAHSPEMRSAVETLVRTELERARTDRSLLGACLLRGGIGVESMLAHAREVGKIAGARHAPRQFRSGLG